MRPRIHPNAAGFHVGVVDGFLSVHIAGGTCLPIRFAPATVPDLLSEQGGIHIVGFNAMLDAVFHSPTTTRACTRTGCYRIHTAGLKARTKSQTFPLRNPANQLPHTWCISGS